MDAPDLAYVTHDRHLDPTDLDCDACGAGPGQPCTSLFYGNGYRVEGGHDGRRDAADLHVFELTGLTGDLASYRCRECSFEDYR